MLVQDVAILGAGPSAAFALLACLDNHISPTVYAPNGIVDPPGAFYLHWLPESLSWRDSYKTTIWWLGMGSPSRYAEKQWDEPLLPTSFPTEDRWTKGYRSEALRRIWGGWPIRETEVLSDRDIQNLAPKYDLVIQTFPSEEGLRRRPRRKVTFPIWSKPLDLGDFILLLYNGGPGAWVRLSIGGGKWSVEYPHDYTMDLELAGNGSWTMETGLDLRPFTRPYTTGPAPNVLMAGRFARWDRTYLSHQTYELTVNKIKQLEKS
jgi:hypothetical protein